MLKEYTDNMANALQGEENRVALEIIEDLRKDWHKAYEDGKITVHEFSDGNLIHRLYVDLLRELIHHDEMKGLKNG